MNSQNNIDGYASLGWNLGLTCGPHHAAIEGGTYPIYAANEEERELCRAAFLAAYREGRQSAESVLGAGQAYSL